MYVAMYTYDHLFVLQLHPLPLAGIGPLVDKDIYTIFVFRMHPSIMNSPITLDVCLHSKTFHFLILITDTYCAPLLLRGRLPACEVG